MKNSTRIAVIARIYLALSLVLFAFVGASCQSNGYGSATYNGLVENEYLKNWKLLDPLFFEYPGGEPSDSALKLFFEQRKVNSISVKAKKPLSALPINGKELSWNSVEDGIGIIDVNQYLSYSEYAMTIAMAEIVMPVAKKELFALGSDDAVRVYINGKEIHSNYICRGLTPDEDLFEAELAKGSNQIIVEVYNYKGGWSFSLRPIGESALSNILGTMAYKGNIDAVQSILSYDIDINKPNVYGMVPWHFAKIAGRKDMAKALESSGAKPDIEFPPIENYIKYLVRNTEKSITPGIEVLVSQDGDIIHKQAYGYAQIENEVLATEDTKHRIGSVTKQFVATSILNLQEQGKISLDDKLSDYIPDFPRGEEVSIKQLLNHTSGIHSFTNVASFIDNVTKPTTSKAVVDSIKTYDYDFDPGQSMQYNNSGYFIAGYIIELITEKTLAEYLDETLFKPLGMNNTGIHAKNLNLTNEAVGYTTGKKGYEVAIDWDMSWAGGAGALYSTLDDLYKWNEAVFSGKVLSDSNLQLAHSPTLLENGEKPNFGDYGLGWGIANKRGLEIISHGGGVHGFLTSLSRYPETNTTVVVFTNCSSPMDGAYPTDLDFRIAEYLFWKNMEEQESFTADSDLKPEDLNIYAGRYDYGSGAVLTVTVEGDKLFAQMTGQPKFQVFSGGEHKFFWKVVEASVVFNVNDKGEITGGTHYQGGQSIDVTKLPEIITVEVSEDILKQYIGKYKVQEGFYVDITVEDGKLMAQGTNQPKTALAPVSENEFQSREANVLVKFIVNGDKVQMAVDLGGGEKLIDRE